MVAPLRVRRAGNADVAWGVVAIMGLLDWFSEKAEKRLRFSQVKLLYQNQSAIEYLNSEYEADPTGSVIGNDILEAMVAFKLAVNNDIITLTYQTTLPDYETKAQMQINAALKNLYSGLIEGKRRARAMFGGSAGDLIEFPARFSPASGWKNFSDAEWDRMVSRACED